MEVNGTTLVPLLDEDGNQVDLAPENWRKLSMQKAIIKWWPEKATPTPQLDDLATLNNFKPFVEALETHFAQEKARLVAEREQIHSTFPDSSEKAEVDMPDVRAQIHKITDSMVALDTKRWTLNRTLRLYDGKAYATVFETLAEPTLSSPLSSTTSPSPSRRSPRSSRTSQSGWSGLSSTSAASRSATPSPSSTIPTTSAPASRPSWKSVPAATTRQCPGMRTTSAPSATAFPPPPAKASASTASPWSSPGPAPSATLSSSLSSARKPSRRREPHFPALTTITWNVPGSEVG